MKNELHVVATSAAVDSRFTFTALLNYWLVPGA